MNEGNMQQPIPSLHDMQSQAINPNGQAMAPQFPSNPPATTPAQLPQQPVQPAPTNPVGLLSVDSNTAQGATTEQAGVSYSDATSNALVSGIQYLCTASKVDFNEAFGIALESGNPAYINHAYLQRVAGTQAGILANQVNALIQHEAQREETVAQSVYQMAGGQQNWDVAVQAFNQNAPAEIKKVLAGLLDTGEPSKVAYAAQEVLRYANAQHGVVNKAPNLLMANRGMNAPTMDKESFIKAERELRSKYPVHSPQYDTQFQALLAQRRAAKERGL